MGLFGSIKGFFTSDAKLSAKQLKRLSDHQYNVQSRSTLLPYLNLYWDWLLFYLPVWLSPNIITFFGLFVNLATVFLLVVFRHEEIPKWLFFICALSIFIYQTLDGLDGKQARRIAFSNPLGEFFDHGCDAFSQVLVSIVACEALNLRLHPNIYLTVILVCEILFYCSHWQAYVSGKLIFNSFDCQEGLLCSIIFCLISGSFGQHIWQIEALPDVQLNILVILLGAVIGFFGIIQYLDIIFSEGAGKNGSTVADTSILSPITPFSLVIIPQIMIYSHSTSSNVFSDELLLFCITFGIVATKSSLKLIIAYLTKSTIPVWDTVFCGPVFIFLNQYYGEILPSYFTLIVCMIYCSINLFTFCWETVRQMKEYLKISCFTLPQEKGGNLTSLSNATLNMTRKL